MTIRNSYMLVTVAAILLATATYSSAGQPVKKYTFKVEETFNHDVSSYTQGLFFHDGQLYESSGQYGESCFRKVDLRTGNVLKRENFGRRYFAEGSCVLGNRLYILTWQEHECFVYDINSWKKLGSFRYQGEGWGLTTDGKSLIMSDGTSVIRYLNPSTFIVEKELKVTMNGKETGYLNELEYINGEIWANIYTTNIIARIDPATGKVTSVIDCTGLLPKSLTKPSTDVLNGIAWDQATNKIYLTGKRWPRLYRITLKEKK